MAQIEGLRSRWLWSDAGLSSRDTNKTRNSAAVNNKSREEVWERKRVMTIGTQHYVCNYRFALPAGFHKNNKKIVIWVCEQQLLCWELSAWIRMVRWVLQAECFCSHSHRGKTTNKRQREGYLEWWWKQTKLHMIEMDVPGQRMEITTRMRVMVWKIAKVCPSLDRRKDTKVQYKGCTKMPGTYCCRRGNGSCLGLSHCGSTGPSPEGETWH